MRKSARFKSAASSAKSFASSGDTPSSGASDITTGWVTLITGLAVSGFLLWKNIYSGSGMGFYEFNVMNTAFVLWIPLMIGMLFLRREPADIGFCTGDIGKGTLAAVACFALFCPVIYIVSSQAPSQLYYLTWMNSSGSILRIFWDQHNYVGGQINAEHLAYHEIIMGLYMFGWEYYHRGFLLNGFKKIMPLWGAVLLQAALFTLLHIGKPIPELISSFPGGILMALLAYRFRSFMPCFLLHWLVSAGFDFAVLYHHFH